MRKLGCLALLVLMGAVLMGVLATMGMTEEERARWVGEKAHRGWNAVKRFAEDARKGWDESKNSQTPPPSPGPEGQ